MLPPISGIVTLLTDFGRLDPYVGVMHGMILRENQRAQVIDLCHGVPAQDVEVAALFLESAVERFPTGTIHVAVVDPGVGTDRRILGAVAHQCYWLAPDNGLLTPILPAATEVRELRPEALRLAIQGRTFHGRDIFAPAAGMLSDAACGFPAIGPRVADPRRLPVSDATGHRVIHVDHFGNLITNVRRTDLLASGATEVRIGGRSVPIRQTYGEGQSGECLAILNSYDLLEIAVRLGHAQRDLGFAVGEPVRI